MKKQVLITTTYRGIYYGTIDWSKRKDDKIDVEDMRHVYSYTAPAGDQKGTYSLATVGPQKGSRVGPVVRRFCIHGVAGVSECTAEAIKAFEAATWC